MKIDKMQYDTYKKFKDAKLAGAIRPISARIIKSNKKQAKVVSKVGRPSTAAKKQRT